MGGHVSHGHAIARTVRGSVPTETLELRITSNHMEHGRGCP